MKTTLKAHKSFGINTSFGSTKKGFINSFTLIELLIVVAIIGILAGVGIPMYQDYLETSKLSALKTNNRNICNLISTTQFKCEFNVYQDLPGIPYQLNCHNSIHQQIQIYALYSSTLFSNPYDKNEKGCRQVGLNPEKKIGLGNAQVGSCVIGYIDSSNSPSGKIIQCVTKIADSLVNITSPKTIVDSAMWNPK